MLVVHFVFLLFYCLHSYKSFQTISDSIALHLFFFTLKNSHWILLLNFQSLLFKVYLPYEWSSDLFGFRFHQMIVFATFYISTSHHTVGSFRCFVVIFMLFQLLYEYFTFSLVSSPLIRWHFLVALYLLNFSVITFAYAYIKGFSAVLLSVFVL